MARKSTGSVAALHKREDDAPEPSTADRSPTGKIDEAVRRALETAKSPDASDTQIMAMTKDLELVRSLAHLGLGMRGALKNSGVRGSNVITIIASTVLAASLAIGLPSLSTSDDAAKAMAATQALAPRVAELESRQLTEERRARRIDALTVRWLGDSLQKNCEGMRAIAEGINTLSTAKRKGEDPAPVVIDCEQVSLPPELVRLVADFDIEQGRKK